VGTPPTTWAVATLAAKVAVALAAKSDGVCVDLVMPVTAVVKMHGLSVGTLLVIWSFLRKWHGLSVFIFSAGGVNGRP